MKCQIYNTVWDIHVVCADEYIKRFGDDTDGLTFTATRQMYFNEDGFNRKLVVHEMLHAYIASKHLTSASLDADQIEEVFCELFAEEGTKILKHAGKIYRELKEQL